MQDEYVTAAVCSSKLDAELALATLAAAGIEAFLQVDDVAGMIGSFQNTPGVKVLVAADRVEEARTLLSDRAVELPPEA